MAVSLTNGSNLFNSSLWLVVWGDDRQVHVCEVSQTRHKRIQNGLDDVRTKSAGLTRGL